MFSVGIKEARFWTVMGLYKEEKSLPNEISITIEVSKNTSLNELPEIDYVTLYKIAEESAEENTGWLEDLMKTIIKKVAEIIDYDGLLVIVEKLHPPTGGDIGASYVKWAENKN